MWLFFTWIIRQLNIFIATEAVVLRTTTLSLAVKPVAFVLSAKYLSSAIYIIRFDLSSYLFDNRLVYRLFANYSPHWKIVKFLFTAICLWKSKIFGLNRDYISERASEKSIKNSICKKYYCQNIQNLNEKLDKS